MNGMGGQSHACRVSCLTGNFKGVQQLTRLQAGSHNLGGLANLLLTSVQEGSLLKQSLIQFLGGHLQSKHIAGTA